MTRLELLKEFVSKAGCMHTQQQEKATRLWEDLSHRISRYESRILFTAWIHHRSGMGREELDEMAKVVREGWAAP